MKGALGLILCTLPSVIAGNCLMDGMDFFTARTGTPPTDCQNVRTLDGPAQVCHWSYDFRSTHATTTAQMLHNDLISCGVTVLAAEDGVNHPDSFAQRLYQTDSGTISIAIKDKTARSETLLFVSVLTH